MSLERETGVEPTTSSLGKKHQNVNKDFSDFPRSPKSIEFTQNSKTAREWNLNGITNYGPANKIEEMSGHEFADVGQ